VPQVLAYHRPETVADVLELLRRPHTTVLAGGTHLNAFPPTQGYEVVDVQALDMAGIRSEDGRLMVGAGVRLSDLAESDEVPALLRELARREMPSVLRDMATVGGTVASRDPESELIAGLLVHEAVLTVATGEGDQQMGLPEVLAAGLPAATLLTDIALAVEGSTAVERTGRTPGDRSIVAAVGRKRPDSSILIALTGVGPTPVLVDPAAPTTGLVPVADFRGSYEYRLMLAATLADRVLGRLG
jgi:CO/xanthine dehydrogenase FAD-binding subunit